MKKIQLLILFIILSSISNRLSAQQLPLYSQYMFNPYMVNSAICGTTEENQLKLNYRDQFSGFGNGSYNMQAFGIDPTPKTISLSYYRGFHDRWSAGIYLFQDQILPIKNLGFQATIAYRFPLLNNLNMSLAISPTFNSLSFDNTIIQPNNPADELVDPTFVGDLEKSSNIDVNFGIYFFNDRFDFGFSVANLAESEYIGIPSIEPSTNDDFTNDRIQHYLLHSSYNFQFDWASSWAMVPSFLIKSTKVTDPQVDLNLKLIYMDFFWIGSSWRTSDNAIVPMCGINAQFFFLGYSYDISTSPLASHYAGSHSITLGIYFNNKKDYRNVRKRNRFFENRSGPLYWYPDWL
ncbi:MAG: hypothetical protein CMP74_04700 [Flavobacteriales bacterium]|nr:hypothetical protein [Flavobacteriales bacterium]|tara:strand:+ start:3339 stop:4385 length:1047 start_codon:yes stop_codon:yes gene_type:complete